MTKLKLVYTTFSSKEDAKRLTKLLLKERLIACANMSSNITSIYEWEGKIQEDNEVIVLYKTMQKKIPSLMNCIQKNHPYEIPCIAVLDLQMINQDFENWVKNFIEN
jgi:periplasmic divalent cation tolerance protein